MVVTRCNSRGYKSDQTSHDIRGATCAVAKFDQASTRAKHALSDKDKSQPDGQGSMADKPSTTIQGTGLWTYGYLYS